MLVIGDFFVAESHYHEAVFLYEVELLVAFTHQ
jgi:hypothetical protein